MRNLSSCCTLGDFSLWSPWRKLALSSSETIKKKKKKSLPSGTGSRSEVQDFRGVARNRKVCMSHNKNLAPLTGTQLLLEMYKIGPTKVLCPLDKDKGVGQVALL